MGLFDTIKKQSVQETDAVPRPESKTTEIVFDTLPETLEQFMELPQAALATPFDTAALTVLAFCFYPTDRETALSMLDFLRGPRPLSTFDKQFIRDRFMDADYVPRSYFKGAIPQNDYLPVQPYTVAVSTNPYSYQEEHFAKLFLRSGGADNPREIKLRLAKDGKWYLWEQYILSGIRSPQSSDPWA